MSDMLRPDENIWFVKNDGQKGLRSLDAPRRAKQLTIKVIGDRADRKARSVLISFNVEGWAYEISDPNQLRAIIAKLDSAHRMLTGRGEAKIISYRDESIPDNYLYNVSH